MDTVKSDSGMTVVEALLALFIMGLASALIILSMPPRPAPIEVAIYKLEDLAQTARQSALVKGAWTGVVSDGEQYKLASYHKGQWRASTARPRRIRGELSFKDGLERADDSPILQFGPTGAAGEETVTLTIGVQERSLSVAPDGEITVGGQP